MSEPTAPHDAFGYPELLRVAFLGLVRGVLRRVAAEGLPESHHFYLTFRTDSEGVGMPRRLRERHPKEMTIVLQHQFWDLTVEDEAFAVSLRFGGAPERLIIPFAALTAFADPSASFGLRLEVSGAAEATASQKRASRAAPSGAGANVVPFRAARRRTRNTDTDDGTG